MRRTDVMGIRQRRHVKLRDKGRIRRKAAPARAIDATRHPIQVCVGWQIFSPSGLAGQLSRSVPQSKCAQNYRQKLRNLNIRRSETFSENLSDCPNSNL